MRAEQANSLVEHSADGLLLKPRKTGESYRVKSFSEQDYLNNSALSMVVRIKTRSEDTFGPGHRIALKPLLPSHLTPRTNIPQKPLTQIQGYI